MGGFTLLCKEIMLMVLIGSQVSSSHVREMAFVPSSDKHIIHKINSFFCTVIFPIGLYLSPPCLPSSRDHFL